MTGNQAVIVLGMHRSGTSMIAGVLHKLGVHMGEPDRLMIGDMPEQPVGYYEDRDFMKANQTILTACHAGWQNPPAPDALNEISPMMLADIAGLLKKRKTSSHAVWGWKDPRTCLTLPIYLPYLKRPKIIIVKRKMAAVVRSLVKREKGLISEEKAASLYHAYMGRLILFTKDIPKEDKLQIRYEEMIAYREIGPIVEFLGLTPEPKQLGQARLHIQPELNRSGVYGDG